MQMRKLAILSLFLVPLAGCAGKQAAVLGADLPARAITAVRDLKPSAEPVTVKGTMTEKCPVAGCWFMLRDKTGIIKVDTKGAGFVVTDVPLNTEVTVTGTVPASGERLVAAKGMRY